MLPPVVVEASHGSEVCGVDVGGICSSNQAVGVSWIADDASFDVFVGVLVHGLSNCRKDCTIVLIIESKKLKTGRHTLKHIQQQQHHYCDDVSKSLPSTNRCAPFPVLGAWRQQGMQNPRHQTQPPACQFGRP
jgi:hypothetical protein